MEEESESKKGLKLDSDVVHWGRMFTSPITALSPRTLSRGVFGWRAQSWWSVFFPVKMLDDANIQICLFGFRVARACLRPACETSLHGFALNNLFIKAILNIQDDDAAPHHHERLPVKLDWLGLPLPRDSWERSSPPTTLKRMEGWVPARLLSAPSLSGLFRPLCVVPAASIITGAACLCQRGLGRPSIQLWAAVQIQDTV